MNIIKRDSTIEAFDINKILEALKKAFKNCSVQYDNNDIKDISRYILTSIDDIEETNINIEKIQDIVERSLMFFNYFDVAKHYISYRNDRSNKRKYNSYINKIPDDVETKWGEIGYITYKRTYARRLNEEDENDDNTEEFRDSILRVLEGCQRQLKTNFTNNELKKAYYYLKSLKGSVAGRFLWQLNTKTVDKLGLMSLQNCAFTKIDKPIRPFLWIFSSLMVGSGVGFNIQKENVDKLPNILDKDITITRLDTNDADFIIPDSREGWVSLLEKVLEAYYYKGVSFTYSTILIRTKGKKIKGFGGLASGPEELVIGIKNIQNILNSKRGSKLSSVDCLDIINIIASIVVSGNVRRCIPYNSLVHTKNGLIKIKDIQVNDEVLTSDGYHKVNNVFKQGHQEIIKIITYDGEFECTPNHRMAVIRGLDDIEWVEAQYLRDGDILRTSRVSIDGINTRLPYYNNMNIPELTNAMAWFIGYFHSNGFIYINDDIKCNSYFNIYVYDNYDIVNKLLEQIELFNNDLDIRIRKIKNNYIIECNDYDLTYYLYKNIKTSYEITEIPNYIKQSKENIKLAYLAGVIDSNDLENNKKNLIVSSVNIKWIKDIQLLSYSCGFEVRIHLNKNYKEHNKNWYVNNFISIDTLHSFNIITNIPELNKSLKYNKKSHKLNGFPLYYLEDLKDRYKNNNIISINNFENKYNKINYCPTKVVRVEYNRDIVDTYDIEVDDKHEFYCNGYLTHNSALLALGDYDDKEYLNAKRWDLGNIPNWRALSNNSVVCNDFSKLSDDFWNGYNGNGEPYGLVNLELSRKIGRIKDGDKYKDPTVEGYNPCCEISLSNYETCCLSEIYLCNIETYEELKELATILYRICKHSLIIKCHEPETEEIVHKNTRIGLGITGYMQCNEEQKKWLDPLYEYLREYDIEYSKKINCDVSIKLTTVKPSGTLSLLAGVTSGAHPAIYKHFIRRIRIASNNHNLINLCKAHKYYVEYQKNFDGTDDKNTVIVEFPCKYPDNVILAENMTAIDQLETIKELQHNWSDNAVSVTIYYRLHELEDIKKWLLENYNNNIKTCSFLLHNDHGFKQAPYEKITKEKYEELVKNTIPITSGKIDLLKDNELISECVGGICPIR